MGYINVVLLNEPQHSGKAIHERVPTRRLEDPRKKSPFGLLKWPFPWFPWKMVYRSEWPLAENRDGLCFFIHYSFYKINQ